MKKYALLSVSDKTGLIDFAIFLQRQGYDLLSTGGTKSHLEQNGLRVQGVSDHTKSPEILSGRVKTLHPKIHGGLLARTSNPDDLRDLQLIDASPIEVVVVNLYPFREKLKELEARGNKSKESLIEFIDIGGPAMLRASAKNFAFVTVVSDPDDYSRVQAEMVEGVVSPKTRMYLAQKVFTLTAAYDSAVARYLSLGEEPLEENGTKKLCAPVEGVVANMAQPLRYGENPHQVAALYSYGETRFWNQLQGKELSYNNMVDLEAALELLLELEEGDFGGEAAVIIKHTNPCGSAIRKTLLEAYQAARACDPVSAFGGIIAVSTTVKKDLAEVILEGFVEVVLAPAYDNEASALFAQKKNVRLLTIDFPEARSWKKSRRVIVRNFLNELLIQQADSTIVSSSETGVTVEGTTGYKTVAKDLDFAWRVSKHVKSNAIVLVKGLQAIGVGAGQMSRLDSARIAIERARAHGFDVTGAVAASDAFLPFPDTLEILNDAGVTALVQPGGSMRDDTVTESAKKRGMTMVLTGERHFRH